MNEILSLTPGCFGFNDHLDKVFVKKNLFRNFRNVIKFFKCFCFPFCVVNLADLIEVVAYLNLTFKSRLRINNVCHKFL